MLHWNIIYILYIYNPTRTTKVMQTIMYENLSKSSTFCKKSLDAFQQNEHKKPFTQFIILFIR